MPIRIDFLGGKKVNARFNGFLVETDQPVSDGGSGVAPTPFDLFLAALGTCAGVYVLGFCQQRRLNTAGLEIIQTMKADPHRHLIEEVQLEIILPDDFPEKYRPAIIQAAQLCTIKRHLENPPRFHITTRSPGT